MNKQRVRLIRILAAAALFALALALGGIETVGPITGRQAAMGLELAAYLAVGLPVLKKALRNIFGGQVFDENFLMALATVGALALGEWAEALEVMLFYQVGEQFEDWAVGKSRRSITALMDIRPDYANLLDADGVGRRVSPEEVVPGDLIEVLPGEKIPLDGVVTTGVSAVNTAALTGESLPREAVPGSELLNGCINLTGRLVVKVSRPFEESTVAKILDLVENASSQKAPVENFITKFARYYTPAVVAAALVAAVVPPLLFHAQWSVWVYRALTFLVISCPCALVISVPLGFFGGIGGASGAGILVKGSNYLEALAKAETVVFDKTGTLTKGVFKVLAAEPAPGISREELLSTAALAESYSTHPIALSLRGAVEQALDPARLGQVEELAGRGVRAVVDGASVLVGNALLMTENGIAPAAGDGAATAVHVARDGAYLGCISIGDEAKDDAAAGIAALSAMGINTVMLTGDSDAAGRAAAQKLGMSHVFTQLLPGDKVTKLEELLAEKSQKGAVCFVGDGINDAPVLARADVGIAMGGVGSDAAIEAADVVLMTDEPSRVAAAIRIGRRTMGIVRQNIWFALGVKLGVLALSALGLVNMQAAVFADVGVAVLAIFNSIRALSVKKAL